MALKASCGLSYLVAANERTVYFFFQALTVCSLQKLYGLLSGTRCWEFSIAFDGATNNGSSYFDVRIRLAMVGKISNFHVLAIPMTGSQTGDKMFRYIKTLMSSFVGENWIGKLIGVTFEARLKWWESTVEQLLEFSPWHYPGFTEYGAAPTNSNWLCRRLCHQA